MIRYNVEHLKKCFNKLNIHHDPKLTVNSVKLKADKRIVKSCLRVLASHEEKPLLPSLSTHFFIIF